MKNYTANFRYLAGFLVLAFTSSVFAQNANFRLEQIIVTAQKREESQQEVPQSVSYLSGEKLTDVNINKIADITSFVPNFTSTETGSSTQMYIRGIGSGNNQGFEQSVGQYIDGVYYGRQQLIRMPYLDLQSVEVLHGPQSTLFGRNTIAGALNMRTARPTADFNAEITGLYETKAEQEELTAYISGPLSDNFRARFAIRDYQESGYIENTLTGKDEPERDETAARLSLEWDINTDLMIGLSHELNQFDTRGRQVEILQDDPNLYPPGSTPIAGLNFAQILPLFGQPAHDTSQDYRRQANVEEFSDNKLGNTTLTVDYDLGENRLQSISAWVDYDFSESCDCDFTPAQVFDTAFFENYTQFSQEIRLTSPSNAGNEWIVGAYYQTTEIDFRDAISVRANSMLPLVSNTLSPILGTSADRDFDQDGDSLAVFGQYSWSLGDLIITLGGRYTREKKSATRRVDIVEIASGNTTGSPFAPFVFEQAFGIINDQASGHNLVGSRNESALTPSLGMEYWFYPDMMIYASWRRGFKAGGFDARANSPRSFEFEEEDADNFEFGIKSSVFDNRGEFNLAWFYTDYDNLQISQFDGFSGFNVGNAKNSVVKGIDASGRYLFSERLSLNYALAWLDYEFRDFRNGNCYSRQTPDGLVVDGVALCDYTGSAGKYTPETTANVSLSHELPLINGLQLNSTLDILYTGSQSVHENQDPAFDIDPYTLVNLRVAVSGQNWSLALLGKNLLDEQVVTYAANVPLTDNLFGTNTYYGFVDRPLSLALEGRYSF